MKSFIVKDVDIAAGSQNVVILNEKDAQNLDLFHSDRLFVRRKNKKTVAILNIAESSKAVPPGRVGLLEEVLTALGVRHNDKVFVSLASKPKGLEFIRNKINGRELSFKEIKIIIEEIIQKKFTDIELTSFIVANYINGMSLREIISTTKAMSVTGSSLKFNKFPVVDKHCIGGIPGNRTTMIVVPLLVAAGICCPKTSSRAITSPAGTADCMEVLCPVNLPISQLKKNISDVGGFIVWGGAVDLAPADDLIIKVEHSLNLTSEGNMIASILAKKISVNPDFLLIDIPIGKEAKIADKKTALKLKKKIEVVSSHFGIKVKVVITDGSQPIGKGVGPVLEARDCLKVLKNDVGAPEDLKRKCLKMAGVLFELCGKSKKGKGLQLAKTLLKSGAAYGAFVRMVEAQGGKEIDPDCLPKAGFVRKIRAEKSGVVSGLSNIYIAKIARLAGAPKTASAGVEILKHKHDLVKKGEFILVIHSKNKQKLESAVKEYHSSKPFEIV